MYKTSLQFAHNTDGGYSFPISSMISNVMISFEPRCEKTGLRGFRPGPTQTGDVQLQKMARGLKFRIIKVEGL